MFEVLFVIVPMAVAGALYLVSNHSKGEEFRAVNQRVLNEFVMNAAENGGVMGFTQEQYSTLLFDREFAIVSALRPPDELGGFERIKLTFYTRAFSLDLKEPSKRADRRRLLQGFGIDGQFGFRAKDHEILELLTEDLASALVDASEAGWTLLNVTPDALDLSPNKVYRYAPFALEWRPGSARTVAQAREELEGLLPVAARAARAWRVDTDRPTRLAALARSPTVSDEVNWRATHRLLTAHAKSDAARELTRSLDGLSEATRMACVTWGTCRNLDDGTHAALLHDVVTKGPAAMVDALVARLEKEGVGAVHASALKALSARGVDLSAFKRKADAAGEASGGQLSVADAGTLGALSEAAPTDLGGALTRKDRGGSD